MGRRGAWQYAQQERERRARQRTNPIWRGVGCMMVMVIGALGYAFASWFLVQNSLNGWVYLPPEVINPAGPDFLRGGNLVRYVMTLLFSLTAFGVLNFVYAILFPVKPGEHDLPTPRSSPAKRRQRRRK